MLSVYITSLVPAGLTFIFWIIAANYTNPEIIGIVVVLGSFSTIMITIGGLDVPIGMKRFLGQAKVKEDWTTFKQIVSASMLISVGTSCVILIIALNPVFNILQHFGIDEKFIPIIIVIVIANSFINILVNVLVSALRSKFLVIPYVISSVGRFPILFALFFLIEISEISVAWAYSSHYIILTVSLLIINILFLRKTPGSSFQNLFSNIKMVVHGSFAKWIPSLIGIIETQSGILAIFALKGGLETGLYYISFAIFGIISMIPSAINSVSHPVLSGMELNEQKKLLSQTIKFGFILTMPIAVIAFFYAEPILTVFGEDFIVSTDIISILLIALPMAIIMDGCYYLLFARGSYKKLLYIGLSVNAVRIISYLILIPIFGGFGTAIAYVLGTVLQLILTLIIVRELKLELQFKMYALIITIPAVTGFLVEFINIGIIGVLIILIGSFLTYLKLKIVTEHDIEIFVKMIFSKEQSEIINKKFVARLKKFHLM
jgi:O-antigen/teichoic acid export membrane protein